MTPEEIFKKTCATVDALSPENAEVVIELALRMQRMVKGAGSLGVLALSLCSSSITAGLALEQDRPRIVAAGPVNDPMH